MLDLSESGGDIAEKLFVLLDEKQQKELTSYVITRNIQDCSFSGSLPDVFNNSPAQADSIQTLTEIRDGDLYFCLEGRTVCIRDQEIDLTAKEFDALHLLIINRRRVRLENTGGIKAKITTMFPERMASGTVQRCCGCWRTNGISAPM